MFLRKLPTEPIFFAHIPKTAGTSFRQAGIRAWGKSRVWLDYGDSKHTSVAVARLVHRQPDYYKFQQQLVRSGICMLSGHAPIRYYRRIFPADRLVTLVRDPVERVTSHFHTACARQGYRDDFQTFCRIPENQNVQSRYLEQMPMELIGFIGLTERYKESLELFNFSYKTDLKQLQLNRHSDRQRNNESMHCSTILTPDELAFARSVNEKDIDLYEKTCALFNQRLELRRNNAPYVHGKLQTISNTHISGWAVQYGNLEKPVQLELYVNGKLHVELIASHYQPAMKERNAGRDGYIGFKHRLQQELSPDDHVEIRVAGSRQILNGPRKIPMSTTETQENATARAANDATNDLQANQLRLAI